MKYTCEIETDKFTEAVCGAYDYPVVEYTEKGKVISRNSFKGKRVFEGWDKPIIPDSFSIGLIIGPSGSGKTLLLNQFGKEIAPKWNPKKAIVSHFSSPQEAMERLDAVGLNTVPSWLSPFHVLSNGEQFRANLARKLESNAVIDEFTSVVDRTVAKSVCVSLSRYAKKHELNNLVLATCHYDILEWLCPDWYFDTADGKLHSGRLLRRPPVTVRMYRCRREAWRLFSKFHYYDKNIASSSRTFCATAKLGDEPERLVGFVSSLPMPSGTIGLRKKKGKYVGAGKHGFPKQAWRASRTVVLPDFQGLGIGPRISDAVALIHLLEGKRYFSKTVHHRLGDWRDRPESGWKPTSKYKPGKNFDGVLYKDARRSRTDRNVSGWGGTRTKAYYSHEYKGTAEQQKRLKTMGLLIDEQGIMYNADIFDIVKGAARIEQRN